MSVKIHPSAVIEPGAELGADCEVGPFSYIGPHVRLGDGCRLQSHVVLDGRTTLGAGCTVYSFACIGKQTQDLKWKGGTAYVEIGPNCSFREYVTIHASSFDGGKTVIGSNCNLLAYCHIAHDCIIGDHVIMSNSTQLSGHVEVGDHCVFGGMGGAVQFIRIGRFSMVGGTAKAVQDVTPFTLVEGSPAEPRMINKIGLERNGFAPEQIRALVETYKIFFRRNLRAEEAAARALAEFPGNAEVAHFVEFVRTSKRGVSRPPTAGKSEG